MPKTYVSLFGSGGDFLPSAGGGAPNLVSIVIEDAQPFQIKITYDASLDTGSVAAISRFWSVDTHRVTAVAIGGTDNKVLTLTFLHAFYFGETVQLWYITPTLNGGNKIRAAGAGSPVADILGAAVTNNLASTGNNYFVAPDTGNDANAGTSEGSPWKTIPGTRTTSNSGFLNSAWGAITTSNKLSAGDQIWIKASTTMASAAGGKLQIDSSYYNNGTAGHPIIIRVSPTWGSDGKFLYNGSGITVPSDNGLVGVFNRAYIHIHGANATRKFEVSNAVNQAGILFKGTSSGTRSAGYVLDHAEIHDCNYIGLDSYYTDLMVVRRTHSHDNGSSTGLGVSLGGVNDALCTNVLLDGGITNGNGAAGSSGIRHGVGVYACTNVLIKDWDSYDNGRDGYDVGTVSNSGTCNGVLLNCRGHNNNEDGMGHNGGTGATVEWYAINSIFFNNSNGVQTYEGCYLHLWHCLFHTNSNSNFGGDVLTYSGAVSSPITRVELRNNIFYKVDANSYHVSSYTGDVPTIDSNGNLWIPRSADSERLSEWPYGGTQYTHTGATPSWWGGSEKRGISQDPGFVSAASVVDVNANDYHLSSSGSSAVASGIWQSARDEALFDRDGVERPNPPAIGLYEYAA